MSEKDKGKSGTQPPKNIPKDAQVIMAIMKEMGINEYDPKCLVQLTEFVYRYATCVLEDSRNFAYNCKKKYLDIEDVKLALSLTNEKCFVQPPPREVLLECARIKNNIPLPIVKPHCGLRLPPDRYCLSASNYLLKFNQKNAKVMTGPLSNHKIGGKQQSVSYIKRSNLSPILKQAVTIPKPVINLQQSVVVKPKIQGEGEEESSGFKRKREDDENLL